jgi:hypothetical protein
MKPEEAEEYLRQMRDRANPFVGHEGIGSGISLQDKDGVLVVKESLFSQLIVVLSLLLFGPGLSCMAFFQKDSLKRHPTAILLIMAFFSLIGWIFGFKYLYRLLAGRRVEIRLADGSIEFFSGGSEPSRRIERSEVQGIENHKTRYRTENGLMVDNFTLRLTLTGGVVVDLCTSDSLAKIEAVQSSLRSILGR